MMKILIASKNQHKVDEIRNEWRGLDIELLDLSFFPDIPEVIEDGETFHKNSIKKAREVFLHTGITTIADDSGLEVDYLGGAPGVFSARFSGEDCNYVKNNEKLLSLLGNIPFEKRTARFRCVMTLYNDRLNETVEGIVEGHIIDKPRGNQGFGYDPLFLPKGFTKTMAEMNMEEKNSISHRGKAVREMKKIIEKLIEEQLL